MKTFRNKVKEYPVNFTLNNTVDKDVQSMLLPLNLTQYFMFCPKYRIKDNIITPNSLISNFVSMILTLFLICSCLYCAYLVFLDKGDLEYPSYTYILAIFNSIFYCFGFAMHFVIGIIQTKKHVQFVLTFQKVHRFLNYDTSFNHFIIWNWILGIIALSFYVFVFTYFILKINASFYAVYDGYLLVIFDLNIVYAMRVIKLLKNKVILWNHLLLNSRDLQNMDYIKYCKKMFQAYVQILECYNIYKIGFQLFILYHMIEIAVNCLSYTQVAIETFKKGKIIDDIMDGTIARSLSVLSWLVKDFTWQTMLIQQCEKFYLAIQSVQDTCALIQKTTYSDDEKKLCKNILRLHRASFSKIRMCGLFYLDSVLQLSLMSFITNHTIVLLQFAFL